MVHTVTVTQLNKYIKKLIDNDVNISNLIVKAEISNFKRHYSGHCYLTLKDESGTLKAVMFKGAADKLKFEPENGMKVLAQGKVSVYERDGGYQLYISSMQPDGVGALNLAFEQLKNKLDELGLFDISRKKPIPKFPKSIGVITSSTGAAVRDIVNVITRRAPFVEIVIYPVLVQGDGASADIVKAIKYFNESENVDVIIAGRGGGSIEDLWAFNEENTALAIANSVIPIISAVGHETDFTIADFVADLRAPTPSAAAELAVPSKVELSGNVKTLSGRMLFSVNKYLQKNKEILNRLSVKSPINNINQYKMRIDDFTKHLINYKNIILEGKKNSFVVLLTALDSLSPLKVMNRGYGVVEALVQDNLLYNKKLLTSVKETSIGENISVRLTDGIINASVTNIENIKLS